MSCNNPLYGYRAPTPNERTGKYPVLFTGSNQSGDYLPVPCGKCKGCQQDRSIAWGIRCVHELTDHDQACFVTLTYEDIYLPYDGNLCPKHLADFWKRLRKHTRLKLKYFACGEYGTRTFRPHYHAIIFGYKPHDLVVSKKTEAGYPLYQSSELLSLWKKGMVVIGDVNFATAQYVAKYINKSTDIKKMFKNNDTFQPPFSRSSQNLGINYLSKHFKEIYRFDTIVIEGNKYKPPRAYDKWMEIHAPQLLTEVKLDRKIKMLEKEKLTLTEKNMQGIARETIMQHGERDETKDK